MAIDLDPFQLTTRILLRTSDSSELGGISLAGTLRNSAGCGRPNMRILGAYAAVYSIRGGGRYEDALGQNRAIRPGDLIIVFPDLPHRYGPAGPGDSWDEIYFVFDGPIFAAWDREKVLRRERPVHHIEPIDYWLHRLTSVVEGCQQPESLWPLLQICRLQQVLAEALTLEAAGPTPDADNRWLGRAKAMLEADLHRDLDPDALERQMAMPYDSFRRRFTRLVGMPPVRYRSKRLMDRACELMQLGQLSNVQIARELGFCDAFHFSRRFKQMVGCCPRDFRRRLPRAAAPQAPGDQC